MLILNEQTFFTELVLSVMKFAQPPTGVTATEGTCKAGDTQSISSHPLIAESVSRIDGGGGGIRRLSCGLKPESISLYWAFKQNQHLLRDCQT